ncbi:50S ribosomal protein L22 [Candidatus Berkelbacteria bacterium RBG_13_40_8]|uniref:50S ribosomal protein L22 n=1 Tax=Candidatus Berkelbacteria bacterium RBG_13_40_8 TaxID=1797467 RepID=A0A1F5DQR0_9BACT|nr:MAG: 50S ribosomal protein L22 [Candidatus Berkelbacteria bacterium RBG_13_40_8]
MMEIVSKAKFVRVAPDKIRILSALIKGKTIDGSINQLSFSNREAKKPLLLVLKQLKDQIKAKNKEITDFKVKSVQVDEGPKLKRRRILHQGRATQILKRMSHITIVLADKSSLKVKAQSSKEKEKNEKK